MHLLYLKVVGYKCIMCVSSISYTFLCNAVLMNTFVNYINVVKVILYMSSYHIPPRVFAIFHFSCEK